MFFCLWFINIVKVLYAINKGLQMSCKCLETKDECLLMPYKWFTEEPCFEALTTFSHVAVFWNFAWKNFADKAICFYHIFRSNILVKEKPITLCKIPANCRYFICKASNI